MRILLVEDEEMLGATIKEGLEMSSFDVDWVKDGRTGLERAFEHPCHLMLLDLMLPEMDGLTVCQQLRERKINIPVLMLTARDTIEDRVRGLETGADDYLPKPFVFNELRARIRALLRRERVQRSSILRFADVMIDTAAHRVTVAGREVTLTSREFSLLVALATNEGRVLSQERILERVWGDDSTASNTVEVYVSSLRRKIDAGRPVRLIHTVRKLGYTLRVPMDTE